MRCNALSIVRCAAVVLFLGAIPSLAQQKDEVPSLRTEDVRTQETPPSSSPAAGGDVEALCREARDRRDSYFEIWKNQFLKRNRMERDYFDTHVQVRKYDVECDWESGLAFRVEYTVKFDWAAIEAQDQIVVMLYERESAYRHLPIARDHFFDEFEVAFAIDRELFFSGISSVKPAAKLAFPSHAAALEAFRKKAGTRDLDNVRLAFYVPGNVPRIDGHPYMLGRGTVDAAKNLCVEGYVNLATGKIVTWSNACIVHSRGFDRTPVSTAACTARGSGPPLISADQSVPPKASRGTSRPSLRPTAPQTRTFRMSIVRIRDASVVGLTPSSSAAPPGP